MTLKEQIIKQKGKWLITYKKKKWSGERYVLDKMVLDLDNMLFDDYEWYKLSDMQGDITIDQIDNILKGVKSIKRIGVNK